jgi:SAM-dependent methyltransferase
MTDSGSFTYASDELDALAGAVNYYRWIMESFGPRLGRRIVEVGAGVGTCSAYLLEAAPQASLTAIEPAANNVPVLRERFAGEPRVAVRQGYLDETLEAGSADTVVAVNVMEHVEDDAAFLRAARRLLTPGGHLLLFVPAVPAIFGTLDEAFEHFRRYTRRELDAKVRAAGFRVDLLRYVNLPGVAAWWLSGKVLRRRTITASAARTYDRWVIPWISALERRWSPPIGQSLLLVARKE